MTWSEGELKDWEKGRERSHEGRKVIQINKPVIPRDAAFLILWLLLGAQPPVEERQGEAQGEDQEAGQQAGGEGWQQELA